MKKRFVQTIPSGGHSFGQVSSPVDLMGAQDFAHDRIGGTVQDFINNSRTTEITGFTYSLGAGTAFNITIKRPGRIYTKDGISYELLADTTLAFPAADVASPRLDLVVAVLDDAVPADLDMISFVRLRTADEFSQSVPPYPPANIEAPRELHWRAVPRIISGNHSATPSLPGHGSNEVPLYIVAVAGGATQIRDADVIDLRDVIQTLRKINEIAATLNIDVSGLTSRVATLEKLEAVPVDLSQVFGEIRTLGAILADLQKQIIASRDLPEIRYDRPKVALTDHASSKINATGGSASGVPYVDIEVGGRINFGDAEVTIVPQKFADQTLNPRFVTVGSAAGNVRRSVNLTPDTVTQTAGDGYVDFLERASQFSVSRGRPASAARNGQFIEVFGGLASDNNSMLGDWLTYDLTNDTLTERTPLATLNSADRPAMFSYGDGTHVLLISGSQSDDHPHCYKLNAVTGGVTEITTTRPTGVWFFGDLIAAGKIFITAVRAVTGGFETDYWEFDTGTDTFTQLGVTGSVPTPQLDCAQGCFYIENKFIMVTFDVTARTGSGRTYIFDRASLQWTRLENIAEPYSGTPAQQFPITRFRMANVNGRPLLVGGLLQRDNNAELAKVWEFKHTVPIGGDGASSLGWVPWDATFPPVSDHGLCSSLGGKSLPDGKAFLFAGHGRYSNALPKIYASVIGGLIAVTYGGNPGVSIASSSTYVQFEVPPFTAPWKVAAYLGVFAGTFDRSTMRAEVSLDNGVHWHEIDPDGRMLAIDDSDGPGVRRLRITLYKNDAKPPILTRVDEVLDEDGGQLEDRLAVRYNTSTTTVQALYIDRAGVVTVTPLIGPSTPLRALIHKVTPAGTNAPTVKSYINRRRPHVKYSGGVPDWTAPSSSATFDNDMSVPARYVDARGINTAGALPKAIYAIPTPTVTFDAVVNITGLVANGDFYVVEVEG